MGVASKNGTPLSERFKTAARNEDTALASQLETYLTKELQILENRILYHLDEVETGKKSPYDKSVRYIDIASFSANIELRHLNAAPAYYKLKKFCEDPSRDFNLSIVPREGGGIKLQIDLLTPAPRQAKRTNDI